METIIYLIICLLAFNYAESQEEQTTFFQIISGLSVGTIIVLCFKIVTYTLIFILSILKMIF